MKNIILQDNATPVYAFLSFIQTHQAQTETFRGKKVLDCGAGGPVPPLALFHQHGFEAWGIDVSDEQLQRAEAFCREHEINLHLRKGDMRHIPFEDETFDFVYEHYSMCHLTKQDTALAIHEMYRVLKKGGLCFLGVVSTDTWPMVGQEKEPGEFWFDEHGEETVHSAYTDDEVDQLFAEWEIVRKETRVTWFRERAAKITLEDWMNMYSDAQRRYSSEDWKAMYGKRVTKSRYTHLYYFLRKPT